MTQDVTRNPQQGNLPALAQEIRTEIEAARNFARNAMQRAIRVGELLLTAKGRVGHGGYERWVRENLDISRSTAAGYVRLYERRDQLEADTPLREALKQVAGPSKEKPATKPAPATNINPDVARRVAENVQQSHNSPRVIDVESEIIEPPAGRTTEGQSERQTSEVITPATPDTYRYTIEIDVSANSVEVNPWGPTYPDPWGAGMVREFQAVAEKMLRKHRSSDDVAESAERLGIPKKEPEADIGHGDQDALRTRLRQTMEATSMSQGRFATHSGLNQAQLSKFLSGRGLKRGSVDKVRSALDELAPYAD